LALPHLPATQLPQLPLLPQDEVLANLAILQSRRQELVEAGVTPPTGQSLALAEAPTTPPPRPDPVYDEVPTTKWQQYTLPGGSDYNEWLFTWKNAPRGVTYQNSTHWDSRSNFVMHARWDVREDADGNTVLYIDELQSDWHKEIINHIKRFGPRASEEELNRQVAELEGYYQEILLPKLAAEMADWDITSEEAFSWVVSTADQQMHEQGWFYTAHDLLAGWARESRREQDFLESYYRDQAYRLMDGLDEGTAEIKAKLRDDYPEWEPRFAAAVKIARERTPVASVQIPEEYKNRPWREFIEVTAR
jgi:hypothetical protein